MSYIINSTNPFVSVKLTETGREKLAKGALNFTYWAIGDSEIDYKRESVVDANPLVEALSGSSKVLRPKDRQPDIKYFISDGTSVLNPITNSNIRAIKVVVNNEADERGFFSGTTDNYTTLTTSDYVKANGTVPNSAFTGSSYIIVQSGLTVGDYIMFKYTTYYLGDLTPNTNNEPTPNLWYKIVEVSDSQIKLDRNLPDIRTPFGWCSPPSNYNIQYFVYPSGEVKDAFGSGTTSAYWDTGTLSFANNCTVSVVDNPVWCMNNVWSENILGLTGTTNLYEDYQRFGSYDYLGEKEAYLELSLSGTANNTTSLTNCETSSYFDTGLKSLSLIHYTNNTISNFYGEFFHIDGSTNKIFQLHMPTLMYHRRSEATASGTSMGMRFIATGSTNYVGTSGIEYVELIEDPDMVSGKVPQVIGRVYPQLKIVSIHDDEIIAATSYKSNRNWTLPGLNVKAKSPSAGSSTGVLGVGKTMYVTYALENTGTTGYTTALPCQKYSKITNNTSTAKDIEFIIEDIDLLPYMRKIENCVFDGRGFYANTFKLLYQIKDDETTRPDSDSWLQVNFTSASITENDGETIDPKLLEDQTPATNGFILSYALHQANSGNTYSIIEKFNIPLQANPSELNFGDERFFYGNIETYIGATIYKTVLGVSISNSNFNVTSNPTRGTSESEPDLRVTEVGIYDSESELIAIGKLSEPVKLADGDTIMIEMSMDF